MNVRYLGTRMNKRQVRGGTTGKRYSYSVNQPVFKIDPADEAQFAGEMEDGRPKFVFVGSYAPATPPNENQVMEAEGVVKLTISGLKTHLANHPELNHDELEDIMAAEELYENRVGAKVEIQAALNEAHAQGIRQLQEACAHGRLTDDGTSCIECGADILMDDKMEAEGIVRFSIPDLAKHLARHPELTSEELADIHHAEWLGTNRVGALAVIEAAINALV